jgi:hypothetical protein
VRTVGALAAVFGWNLLRARSRSLPMLRGFGMGSAAAFVAVDVIGTLTGRLRPVYLLDALAQVIFIAAWARLDPTRARPDRS